MTCLIGEAVLMETFASSARTPGESARAATETPSSPNLRASAFFNMVFSCWISKKTTTGAFLFGVHDARLPIASHNQKHSQRRDRRQTRVRRRCSPGETD